MTLDQWINLTVAVGTIGAATVALWIALRAEKIRLKVRFYCNVEDDEFSVTISNLGKLPANLLFLSWKIGWRGQRNGLFDSYIPNHPRKILQYGEYDHVTKKATTVFNRSAFKTKSMNTFKLQIHTAIGQTITARPDRKTLRELKKVKQKLMA